MAQNPAFLTNIIIFYVTTFLWKDLGGIGSFLHAVGCRVALHVVLKVKMSRYVQGGREAIRHFSQAS